MNKLLKIYIIHYTKLVERKNSIEEILSEKDIPYEFIEEFDKEDISKADLNQFYVNNNEIYNEKVKLWAESGKENYKLNNAELSCSIKHLIALNKIKNENFKYFLIIEDDVIPKNETFADDIKNLINKKTSWDALFIGEGMGEGFRNNKIGYKRYFPFYSTFKIQHPATNCLDSYIVKKNSIDKILNNLTPINMIIDWELAYQFYKMDLNIHWTKKSIFYQGSKNNIYNSTLR